ncbi:MAG TPA: energy transducer TonB [Candidatus Acidoferrales bacterium]|nr:energy transducer TonB [Candidatus Acidoferrales bacterium]
MGRNHKLGAALAALACLLSPLIALCTPQIADDDATLWDAICPVVYPVDQSSSDHGVHYLFYGNGFFINADGYLITDAHVLSQLHGGQPYVLLRQSAGSLRIVPAILVAIDREHDVAILRVTPNPFAANYKVSFLPLSYDRPLRSQAVLAAALLPSKPRDAYTLNATIEMRSSGEVLDSEFSQLEKGKGDTELLLFNHEILLGQSGAPVLSTDSQKVIGLVEGQWFGHHTLAVAPAEQHALGAILPIHYAIALLQQKQIVWHTSITDSHHQDNAAQQSQGFSPPVPLSLVPAAYPSQTLFGGEAVLDALVDSSGRLADIKVVRGESPFLEKALVAVRTWTFLPARSEGREVETRVGITFQFPQPYVPPRNATVHNYEDASSDSAAKSSADRGALPIVTVEPDYPYGSEERGGVILSADIGQQGQVDSVKVLRDLEPLTPAAVAALRLWHFAPAKHGGANVSSSAIVVFSFTRPAIAAHAQSSRSSQ